MIMLVVAVGLILISSNMSRRLTVTIDLQTPGTWGLIKLANDELTQYE